MGKGRIFGSIAIFASIVAPATWSGCGRLQRPGSLVPGFGILPDGDRDAPVTRVAARRCATRRSSRTTSTVMGRWTAGSLGCRTAWFAGYQRRSRQSLVSHQRIVVWRSRTTCSRLVRCASVPIERRRAEQSADGFRADRHRQPGDLQVPQRQLEPAARSSVHLVASATAVGTADNGDDFTTEPGRPIRSSSPRCRVGARFRRRRRVNRSRAELGRGREGDMKKPLMMVMSSGVAVGVGLALIALYSSCGSTGGGANTGTAAFGQFVSQSCSPEGQTGGGSCFSLSAPNSVPADGTNHLGLSRPAGRRKRGLGSGACRSASRSTTQPSPRFTEPKDGCGLTDGNGIISGQFQDGTNPGSFTLVATAQAGFGLQARRTISFTSGGPPLGPGVVTSPCASDTDCNPALFCSFNDTCFPGVSQCTQKITTGRLLRGCRVRVGNMQWRDVSGDRDGDAPRTVSVYPSTQCVSTCCDSNSPATPASLQRRAVACILNNRALL